MSKKAYVGVSNVARKVTGIYVGVNGVARKVIKGYVGVNGVAQPFYDNSGPVITYINYIESTGTQYINTGLALDTISKIEVDFALTDATQTNANVLIGIQAGLTGNPTVESFYRGDGTRYARISRKTETVTYNTPDTNRHTLRIDRANLSSEFDGVTVTYTKTYAGNLVLYLFCEHNLNSSTSTDGPAKYIKSKVYSLKITNTNNTVIGNFVPILAGSTPAFLDTITNQIFYNLGTGTFNYG